MPQAGTIGGRRYPVLAVTAPKMIPAKRLWGISSDRAGALLAGALE